VRIAHHLLRFLAPFRWQVGLATVLGAVVVASNVGLLGVAGYLITAAAGTHLFILLLIPIYLVRALSVTRGVARYAERLVAHNVTFHILARLRLWLYDRLTLLGPAFLVTRHSGDALARLTADIEELQNAYLRLVAPLAVALLIGALVVSILGMFSAALAWTALGFLLVAGLGMPLLVRILSRQLGQRQLGARTDLHAHLIDSLQGVQDIVSHDGGHAQLRRIAELDRLLMQVQSRMALINAGRESLTDLLGNLAVVTTLAVTVALVGKHSLGDLYVAVPALLVLASFEIIRPLGLAAQTFGHVQMAGERVLGLGDERPLIVDPVERHAQPDKGGLTFDHVTFVYPGSANPTLADVTFTVPVGARVAVVGPSGAGKTTLLQLVIRAWDPTSGAISLGGRDIREYRLADLRTAAGLVAQDTYLFDDTVRNNLLLACPEATDGELMDALEAAQLLDLIRTLPEGLHTRVGEHGLRLSGGERQRLAIARIFLKDARFLLLDEVTANLDLITEWAVLDALHRLMAGRTTLMITHRLVRMEDMDEIMVLDRGRVVERGTHEELRARRGLYQSLLETQQNMLSTTLH